MPAAGEFTHALLRRQLQREMMLSTFCSSDQALQASMSRCTSSEFRHHLVGGLLLDEVMEALYQYRGIREAVSYVIKHSLLAGFRQFLVQVRHAQFGLAPDLAAIGF